LPAKSPLRGCFDRKLWPPSTLKLRVEHYFVLPSGGTIERKVAQLREQLAFENSCAGFIRSEADRRAYETNVAPLLRSIAEYKKMGERLIEDSLKAGSIIAIGFTEPGKPAGPINPTVWHFLTMDYETDRASAPEHGLAFHGIAICDHGDLRRKMAKMAKANATASPASPGVSHSPDFDEVVWRGERFAFGRKQSSVIRILYEAALRGDPWQRGQSVLGQAGSDDTSMKLGNLFSKHPAWGKLILSKGNGLYRIVLE